MSNQVSEETRRKVVKQSLQFNGLSATAIADKIHKRYGLSKAYVRQIIAKEHPNLKPVKISDEQKQEIVKKFNAMVGMEPVDRYKRLAKEYNRSYTTIYNFVKVTAPAPNRKVKEKLFNHRIFPF